MQIKSLDEVINRLQYKADNIKAKLEPSYFTECIEYLKSLPKCDNGWIPCSERLPERNKQVLCWAKSMARGGDVCFTGSCDNGAWFLQTAVDTLSYPAQYEVVAWRELPQPYAKGE